MAFRDVLRKILYWNIKMKSYDQVPFNKIIIDSADKNLVTASLKVEPEHCNLMGALHGGMSANIIDSFSGFAYLASTPEWYTKVLMTVKMDATYLKGIPVGNEILIKCKLDKSGKNLAFASTKIYNKGTGELSCQGSVVFSITPNPNAAEVLRIINETKLD